MRSAQPLRPTLIDAAIEAERRERRRARALFRAPVVAPTGFPKREQRRLYQEAHDEFTRRA